MGALVTGKGMAVKKKAMSVHEPIYDWLVRVRAKLSVQRRRDCTFPEAWEHIKDVYEAAEKAGLA